MASCGGGTSLRPLPPSLSVAIVTPQNGATVSGVVTVSASVSSTYATKGVQFYLDGNPLGPEDTAAPYSVSWDTTSVANGAHSLTATAKDTKGSQATSKEIKVMVNNISITLTPPSATVALGQTFDFVLNVEGIATPTCSALLGQVTLNGSIVSYRAPIEVPANWSDTLTCQASSQNASAPIALQYPLPVIESVGYGWLWLPDKAFIGTIVRGSGFYSQGTVRVENAHLSGASLINHNQIQLHLDFWNGPWSPGWLDTIVTNPAPGGGSATYPWAFLGNLNPLAMGETEIYFLDQGADVIRIYDLNGTPLRTIPLRNPILAYQLALDDITGYLALTTYSMINIVRVKDGFFFGYFANDKPMMVVAARDGWVCTTQPYDNQIACGDLTQLGGAVITGPLLTALVGGEGGQPWPIAMTKLAEQRVAAVFNREDLVFSVVKVPEMNLLASSILVGLTPVSQLPTHLGGWQLAVFGSGPAAGLAALLHQYDKLVVFVDLATGQEIRRVQLEGIPFRIAANNVSGQLVVAKADTAEKKTRFEKINLAGEITPLTNTSDLLCVGLGISRDGAKLYCAMRDQFQVLDLN